MAAEKQIYKYVINYRETYERTYFVEAEDEKTARKILYDDIYEGKQKGPDECVGWEMYVLDTLVRDEDI